MEPAGHFIEWGILHGLALCFHRAFKDRIGKLPKLLTGTVTFVFVNCAWVLFRAEGVYKAGEMFRYVLKGGIGDTFPMLCAAFAGENMNTLLGNIPIHTGFVGSYSIIATIVGFICSLIIVFMAPSSHELATKKEPKGWEGPAYAIMAILAIMTCMSVSKFLYFNF